MSYLVAKRNGIGGRGIVGFAVDSGLDRPLANNIINNNIPAITFSWVLK